MVRMTPEYEGYVKFADSTVISIQCFEGRCRACPDEAPDGEDGSSDVLDGYACEHGCGHGSAEKRNASLPAGLGDAAAVEVIAEWLRDPEWGVGMLEDIADTIRRTGRSVEDYPDGRATWGRH
jgi:hypothetical protein